MFGHGSLVNPSSFSQTLRRPAWDTEDFPLATLQGYRRIWNVAMDNSCSIPGYKRYSDVNNPSIYPEIYVCFLNIQKSLTQSITGVIAQVSPEEMTRLRTRERNYTTFEVTDSMLEPPVDGRVFTFIGSKPARQRFEQGIRNNTAVISAEYEHRVEQAFRQRGPDAHRNYLETTDRSIELRTVELRVNTIPPKQR